MAILKKIRVHECLGEIRIHERSEEMCRFIERKMFHEIGQNSDVSVFSASSSSVVAVCVNKNSKHAVKWALDHLVVEGDQLMLIHVSHPTVAIPTPMGNIPIAQVCSDAVDVYMQNVASQTRKLLWPYQQMCDSKKVQAETIVLEDHNVSKAILEYISKSKIRKLVLGSSNHLMRRLKGCDKPTSIAKKASKFCCVYVISKGKLASIHSRNNISAHSSSSCNSECALVPRGNRVLEPSGTNTNDRNGNQRFEKNRRDFEGAFVSKPDIETELGRLNIELQRTGETYRGAAAFEEAIAANYKAVSLNAQLIEKLGKLDTNDALESADQRCRGYSIEEIKFATDFFSESLKIGEGGYGPVYKGSLDHTTVAIKVLQTDTAQGRDEFQREIEILSRIHHPNMVMLLGTCPERGCLVYEYMENGSLEDQLFHRSERDSLPWFIRFRIASEIATALNFLHTAKPEPIIHCDLKPANILLDHNFVSKIGDVGLAKLIPPTISCTVTEYKMTVLAGTFYYMDPEYVRTGTMLPTSDVYALGIILLQLLTAKSPMGIIEDIQKAIHEGSFNEILDKTAGKWPLEETEEFAKLALKCTELRRRDRPDLKTVVLPELKRFKDLNYADAEDCTS